MKRFSRVMFVLMSVLLLMSFVACSDDDAGESLGIVIKQNGVAIPNGGTFDFGQVAVGTSRTVEFTIENTGSKDLVLSGVPLVGLQGAIDLPNSTNLLMGSLAYLNGIMSCTNDNGSDYDSNPVLVKWKNEDESVKWEYQYTTSGGDPQSGSGSYIFNNYSSSNVTINGTLNYDITYDNVTNFEHIFTGNMAYEYNGETLTLVYSYTMSFLNGVISFSGYQEIDGLKFYYATSGGVDYGALTPFFSVSALPNTTLVIPGGSTTFSVTINPSKNGVQEKTIVILNNDPNRANFSFKVVGGEPLWTVTYDGNGADSGSVPVDSDSYINGQQVIISGNTGSLVKSEDGIYFSVVGWNTQEDGNGIDYAFASATFTMGSANVTLYAKWSILRGVGSAGGLVFYDKGSYSDGWRYLEAAPVSTEWTSKVWGGYGTDVSGADGTVIGTGAQNSIDIVTAFGVSEPYESKTDYAAKLCSDLTSGGYSDWFLPSKDELNKMYLNLQSGIDENSVVYVSVGGFADDGYLSSSEFNNNNAWGQYFYDGDQANGGKDVQLRVRAVRAF